jgi:hypothetical protein
VKPNPRWQARDRSGGTSEIIYVYIYSTIFFSTSAFERKHSLNLSWHVCVDTFADFLNLLPDFV